MQLDGVGIQRQPLAQHVHHEIGVRGVTGASLIDLRDDGSALVPLHTSPDEPAEIPIHAGTFQKLEARSTAILDSIERITQQLTHLASDENLHQVQTATANMAALTTSLQRSALAMEPVMLKVGPLMDILGQATGQVNTTARDVAVLTRSAHQLIDTMQADGGALDTATRSMQELSVIAARINHDLVPRLTGMAEDVAGAARGIDRSLQGMRERPQSLLFGPAPLRPGPGEAGFEGFGGQ